MNNTTIGDVRTALEEYNAQLAMKLRIYREALLAIGTATDSDAARQRYATRYGLSSDGPGAIARNALRMVDEIDEG